jgi:hypothetical protein
MAAVEMKDKAVPLTPPDANAMIDLVAPTARARALYWMMWHAASRYDDIKDLTFENFRLNSDASLTVIWTRTKANPLAKQRVDHQMVLQRPPRWFLHHVRHTPNPFHVPSTTAENHMKKIPPAAGDMRHWKRVAPPNVHLRNPYPLHSFKRGAAAVLWERAARHEISTSEVMRILKHSDVRSATDYCPDPTLVARAFATDDAQRILREVLDPSRQQS